MKKHFAILTLAFLTAACAQNGSTQSGMAGMQCKCCQEMMKEGKECCCKGMMSDMKMDMGKDGGKMQCPMCAKMKEGKMSTPAPKTSPDEHEQHH